MTKSLVFVAFVVNSDIITVSCVEQGKTVQHVLFLAIYFVFASADTSSGM
jgi:hypothetical protein